MELGHAHISEKVNFHACLAGNRTPRISENWNFQNCLGRDRTCPDFETLKNELANLSGWTGGTPDSRKKWISKSVLEDIGHVRMAEQV